MPTKAIKKRVERVYVYIDGSNLYHGLKNFVGDGKSVPIGISKFANKLTGENRRLVRILYYTAPLNQKENPKGYAAQQQFLDNLRQTHYLDLRLGRLVKRERSFVCQQCKQTSVFTYHNEKGVDIYLAADLLVNAFDDQYDTAILVSEDGDFVPAVQEIQRLKKKIENAYFKESFLSHKCDKFIHLTKEFIGQCKSC